MDLREEEILGTDIGDHWYYRAKAAAMLAALDEVDAETAIDVGSGSGFFARQLLANTTVRQVDCVDTSYDRDDDETLGPGLVLRRRRDLADVAHGADLALLMDVLEHVDDDADLLRSTASRVRPGGRIFVTVPAFQWLWSGHDEFLGHVRRYTLAEVEQLFARAGLTVERGHYFFGLVLPAAVAQRLADRLRPGGEPTSKLARHSPITNRALAAACLAEVRFQRRNRLGGLSVFVLGRC